MDKEESDHNHNIDVGSTYMPYTFLESSIIV